MGNKGETKINQKGISLLADLFVLIFPENGGLTA